MEQLLNLKNLLEHEIEDLYSAEEQIIEALPLMVKNAKDGELKKALNEHLKITQEQKKRLDKIKQLFKKDGDQDPQSKSFLERIFGGGTKCKGMEGLITEGEKMMKEDMDPQVKDAAIIASAQKIEHYEISGYGTARAFANQLNLVEIERLLQTTLNEEYKSDDLLTALALRKVNIEAEGKESGRQGGAQPSTKKTRSNGQVTSAQSGSNGQVGAKKAASKKSASGKSGAAKGAAKKSGPKKSGRK